MHKINKRCRKMLDLSLKKNEDEVVDNAQNNNSINGASSQEKCQIKILQDIIVKPASSSSNADFQEPQCCSTLRVSSMRVSSYIDNQVTMELTPKRMKIQQPENSIFVSPSTGNTLQVLKNVEHVTPTNKNYPLMSPNVSNLTSRASSISDISCAKDLPCPLSNEEIREIYDTRKQNNESSVTNLNIPSNSGQDFDPDSSDDNYYPNSSDTETDSSGSDDYNSDESVTSYESSSNNEENQLPENTQSSENHNNDEWEDINNTLPDFNEFTDNCRPNIPDDTITPADFYRLFVTDEVIDQMVLHTNNYAQAHISNLTNLKPKSRSRAWYPTNSEEMKQFMGVLLTMGLVRIPRINDYWSKKNIYNNKYISSVITRDRFLLILKFWHFSYDTADDTDKLKKIRDTYNMILERIQILLEPGRYLIIDESMIPWRGRLKFRQYIKNKSHKYGVKLYKLCTPAGYTRNLIIYTGKGDGGREMNHGKKTVLKLITGLENKGRIIITDNFYNSLDLAEELIHKKTFMCGTLRPNRKGNPKTVISMKLKRGEIVGKMNSNGVRVIKWTDKRPVHMISTCRNHDLILKSTGTYVFHWCHFR
jgi:hypothetical protein